MANYARERNFEIFGCGKLQYPSKELMRKYGLRGHPDYWEVWAALEDYFKKAEETNKLLEDVQPKQ